MHQLGAWREGKKESSFFRARYACLSKVLVFVAILNAPVEGSKGLVNKTRHSILGSDCMTLIEMLCLMLMSLCPGWPAAAKVT